MAILDDDSDNPKLYLDDEGIGAPTEEVEMIPVEEEEVELEDAIDEGEGAPTE